MHEIDPKEPIRKAFAEVAGHHSQFWKAVEHAAENNSENVEAGFDGESEDGAVKAAVEKWADHSRRGRVGMQINRNAERFGGLENFPEFRLVEIFAARVGIDDRALQVQRFYGSLEFFRGGGGILRSNRGESGKAVGMLANRFGKLIVERRRQGDGGWRVEDLDAGRGERKNLLRDSRGVHVADAALADILNLRADFGEARSGIIEVETHEARETGVVMRAIFEKLLYRSNNSGGA